MGISYRWAIPCDLALQPRRGWMIGEQNVPFGGSCEPIGPEPYWTNHWPDYASNITDETPGKAVGEDHVPSPSRPTSWGHVFGIDLKCGCGRSWQEHQDAPSRHDPAIEAHANKGRHTPIEITRRRHRAIVVLVDIAKSHGVTQQTLAGWLGVSKSHISYVTSEHRRKQRKLRFAADFDRWDTRWRA